MDYNDYGHIFDLSSTVKCLLVLHTDADLRGKRKESAEMACIIAMLSVEI